MNPRDPNGPHSLGGKCVLMLGMDTAVFLEPLAKCIKTVEPEIRLATAGLTDLDTGSEVGGNRKGTFDFYYPELDGTRGGVPAGWKEASGHSSLSPCRAVRGGFRKILRTSQRARAIRSIDIGFEKIREQVDLVHVHGLFIGPLHRWLLKQRHLPFLVSCWGSDVLRSDQLPTIGIQQQVLRRASAITVTTPEMKEIVLAKYGRELAPKICYAFFPPNLEEIAKGSRGPAGAAFRARHRIGPDKVIVTVGHNANSGGQHIAILESLRGLTAAERAGIHTVVPLSYGGTPEYVTEIRELLTSLDCKSLLLDEYLSERELEELRLASDVFIYAPVSDSFSGTVSQALAAGSAMVLGSWLPNNLRRRAGFRYWEFDAPDGAGPALTELLEHWPAPLHECTPNRELSARFFAPARVGSGWTHAYELALDSPRHPDQS